MLSYLQKKPVTVMMLVLLIIVAGVGSALRLPLEQFGKGFESKRLGVSVYDYNLSPAESDLKVAKPLGSQLKALAEVETVDSTARENRVWFWLKLKSSASIPSAYMAIEGALERAQSYLPDDAKFRIRRFDTNSNRPAMGVMLLNPNNMAVEDFKDLVFNKVIPRVERVKGVANAELEGMGQTVVKIILDHDRIKSLGLRPAKFLNDLKNLGDEVGVGKSGHINFVLKGGVDSVAAIKDFYVTDQVQLKDIAEVVSDRRPAWRQFSYDGQMGVGFLPIHRKGDANLVELCAEVEQVLDDLKQRYEGKVDFVTYRNQGKEIGESLATLSTSGWVAGLIAFVVVFIFLRDVITTTVVAVTIPMAILGTLIWLYFSGLSINLFSMIGIMISIGLVVDNAIVMVEAIDLEMSSQDDDLPLAGIRPAVVAGAKKVVIPLTMGTLTTVGVFLPVVLMADGQMAFYLRKIGLVISSALLSSLVISVFFIPVIIGLLYRFREQLPWLKRRAPEDRASRPGFYSRLLARLLANPLAAMLALVAVIALSFTVESLRKTEAQGRTSTWQFFNVDVEQGLSDAYKRDYMSVLEAEFLAHKDKFDIEHVITSYSRNRIWMALIRTPGSPHTDEQVIAFFQPRLPVKPGLQLKFSRGWEDSPTGEAADYSSRFRISGADSRVLTTIGEAIQQRLSAIPGVKEIAVQEQATTKRDIVIVPEQPQPYPYDLERLIKDLNFAMREREIMKLPSGTDVKAVSSRPLENSYQLREFPVGGNVPLLEVAELSYDRPKSRLRRKNGALSESYSVDFDPALSSKDLREAKANFRAVLTTFQFPPGYGFSRDTLQLQQRQRADFVFGALMSVVLVTIIMAVLFESVLYPIVILLSIPMAYLGVIWVNIVTGGQIQTVGQIGIIVLVGIVVNNGIVLVARINELAEELPLDTAIVKAGGERVRPIIMTAATTIFGLMPMALGKSNMFGIEFASMGYIIIAGMITSTVLTLLYLPLVYKLFYLMRSFMAQLVGVKMSLPLRLPGRQPRS